MLRSAIACALAWLLLATPAGAKSFKDMFPQHADMEAGGARDFLESLDYKQGHVELRGGFAAIDVPEGYYYLGTKDAERVLVDAWGNPPGEEPTLGMIFPVGMTPLDGGGWAVEITWEEIGYVSDADADQIDYADLLKEMQRDTADESAWRAENGYETVMLVGWAAEPRYDRDTRRLHWAQELRFGGNEANSLNYNIRVLGRKGVLVMNFIAEMEDLPAVQAALPDVLALASFGEGARYADFDPSIDQVAAVGISGLIAGKVLAKTGMLALALAFLKKGWILLVLAFGGVWRAMAGSRA